MKGLCNGQVIRRHVLRNALVPTVAMIGVQIGYLFGGIIGVEKIFNYNGMGQPIFRGAPEGHPDAARRAPRSASSTWSRRSSPT